MKKILAATYSPTLLCAVPSAMKGLTSEFGMGSGISPSLAPPMQNSVAENDRTCKRFVEMYFRSVEFSKYIQK